MDRLRSICMSLPEVIERTSHGEPTWFISGKKSFAMSADHHHDDRLAMWCAAPAGAQEELIDTDAEHFFRPPYVGTRGWVGVYLDLADVDWDELGEIIRDAYRTVAPPKLAALVD